MGIEGQSTAISQAIVTVDDRGDKHDDVDKEHSNTVPEGDIIDLTDSLLGLKRESIEEIYDLYCNHAREVGFSVRKSTTRTNRSGIVVEKYYVCSCEGSSRPTISSSTNQGEPKKRKMSITRTECRASLRAKMNCDGLFEIIDHNTIHNHKLTREKWGRMHQSERLNLSEKSSVIEDIISSGMRASDSFRYMAKDAVGEEYAGRSMIDHNNFANRLKIRPIEGADAQALIDTLFKQRAEDRDFFFIVKLDAEGRLCNVFWRDSMMKENYRIYGDVVVFDTTYRTNKYNLICAPFVGINNHWKNVMFACAFITDEKAESFEWLFEVFKKSMEGKSPGSLFTDQDLAIEKAIQKVFPETRHRLCLWHLYHNAVSQFGKLKGDKCFNDVFHKCLSGCTNEEEFEQCWSSMTSKYGLQENCWFERLHILKQKWCTGFDKDFFSVGILSSHRNESSTSAFGFNAKKTTSLKGLYDIFNKTIQRWRNNEVIDESQCSRVTPASILPLSGILKHASEVYTLTIFRDFEGELMKSMSTTCKRLHHEHDTSLYNVMHDDGVSSYDVTFNDVDSSITCSCKRFDECGLLCHHCLRVFHMHSVVKIPDRYIKRRWTKLAKKDLWGRGDSGTLQSDSSEDGIPWRHKMARKYYNLLQEAQENEETRRIIEAGYDRDAAAVEAITTTVHSTEDIDVSSSSNNVIDPAHSVTKEREEKS